MMPPKKQPDSSDLEHRALDGGAFYIGRLERDLSNERLSFALIADPVSPVVVRTLTFFGVQDFREEWDEEEDPDLMEQVIGLHQSAKGRGFQFHIRLDQSEMSFYSEAEPQIVESVPRSEDWQA